MKRREFIAGVLLAGTIPGIEEKFFELLRETIPNASRVGYLAPRGVWDSVYGSAQQLAAQRLGFAIVGATLDDPIQEPEYRRVFAAMVRDRADALVVNVAEENLTYARLIVELAEQARLPTIYPYRQHVVLGGLLAYGPDLADLSRRAAGYIDQILKGAKPGEIPYYQPTRFDLAINLKTAKALDLMIPPNLLARADEVIE